MSRYSEYNCNREGDIVKIEVCDITGRVLYKNKFNIRDKNMIFTMIGMLEKFGGFSVVDLIRKKMEIGEWW